MSPLVPPRSDRATYEREDPGRGAPDTTAGSSGWFGTWGSKTYVFVSVEWFNIVSSFVVIVFSVLLASVPAFSRLFWVLQLQVANAWVCTVSMNAVGGT